MAYRTTRLTIVYSTVISGAYKRKHQSSASLALVRGVHRWPVNSLHKGPVTRRMFPFDDVIMCCPSTTVLQWGEPEGDWSWWRHQMESFSALLALCGGGGFTGPGEFPTQKLVAQSFDVFFDLRLNKQLSKQRWSWWFETQSWSLWRQCNVKWTWHKP